MNTQDLLKRRVLKARKESYYLLDCYMTGDTETIPYKDAPESYQNYMDNRIKPSEEVERTPCRALLYDIETGKCSWEDGEAYERKDKNTCPLTYVGVIAVYCGDLHFFSGSYTKTYLAFMSNVQSRHPGCIHDMETSIIEFIGTKAVLYDKEDDNFIQAPIQQCASYFINAKESHAADRRFRSFQAVPLLDPLSYCLDKQILQKYETTKDGYEWKSLFVNKIPKISKNVSNKRIVLRCEMQLVSSFSVSDKRLKKILSGNIQDIGDYVLKALKKHPDYQNTDISKFQLCDMTVYPGRELILKYCS